MLARSEEHPAECVDRGRRVTLQTVVHEDESLGAALNGAPGLSEACPVCNSAKNEESRIAFLVTTAFLSLLPLGLVAGVLLWMRSSFRAASKTEPADSAV